MLEDAHAFQREGVDVAIGFVETYGRADTEAQIRNLEIIPRRKIDYRGVVLEEMDVDGILRRHPKLCVVDELAHTNVPGSKHEKRYQDVLDIDDRTRQALFVTQASLLASAVLFVLDMSGDDTRPDVPYEPPTRLKILPSGMGALRLEARYSIDELVNW